MSGGPNVNPANESAVDGGDVLQRRSPDQLDFGGRARRGLRGWVGSGIARRGCHGLDGLEARLLPTGDLEKVSRIGDAVEGTSIGTETQTGDLNALAVGRGVQPSPGRNVRQQLRAAVQVIGVNWRISYHGARHRVVLLLHGEDEIIQVGLHVLGHIVVEVVAHDQHHAVAVLGGRLVGQELHEGSWVADVGHGLHFDARRRRIGGRGGDGVGGVVAHVEGLDFAQLVGDQGPAVVLAGVGRVQFPLAGGHVGPAAGGRNAHQPPVVAHRQIVIGHGAGIGQFDIVGQVGFFLARVGVRRDQAVGAAYVADHVAQGEGSGGQVHARAGAAEKHACRRGGQCRTRSGW